MNNYITEYTNDEIPLLSLPKQLLYKRYLQFRREGTKCPQCGLMSWVGDDAFLIYSCHSCGWVVDNMGTATNFEGITLNLYDLWNCLYNITLRFKNEMLDFPIRLKELLEEEGA